MRDVTVTEVLVSPVFWPTYANGTDYTEEDKTALIEAFESISTSRAPRLDPLSRISDADVGAVRRTLRRTSPPQDMFMGVFAPSGPTEKQRGLMMVLQYLSTYDWKGWAKPLYPVPVTAIEQVTLDYILRLLCAKEPLPPFANGNWISAVTHIHGAFLGSSSLAAKTVFSHAVRDFAEPIVDWSAHQCKSFKKLGTPPWCTLCWCTLRLGCTVPRSAVPYHAVLSRTSQCCTVPLPAVPYRSLLYRTVPLHAVPYHSVLYHRTTQYCTVPLSAVPYHPLQQALREGPSTCSGVMTPRS